MVGDYIRTWFDTGALGPTLLYGRVIKAGAKTFTIRWESGICNRLEQDTRAVDYAHIADVDGYAIARLRTTAEKAQIP